MPDKIFDHAPQPLKDRPHVISPVAARGATRGGRLLAMMVAAVILVIIASAIINYFY